MRDDLVEEVWRPVVGWEDRYQVSNLGRVRSLPPHGKGRPLATSKPDGWYPAVQLCRPGTARTKRVHLLVLEAFVGPRPPGMEGRHLNGRSDDPRLDNLAWGTKQENIDDRRRHGTLAKKLTAEAVTEIRNLAAQNVRVSDIARRFAISRRATQNIIQLRQWKHVESEKPPVGKWLKGRQVLARLRRLIKEAGSQAAWATANGFSTSYVNDVLNGRRDLSDAMCDAIGVIRTVSYALKQPESP